MSSNFKLLEWKKLTDNGANKCFTVGSILNHETRTKSKSPRLIKQLASVYVHVSNSP